MVPFPIPAIVINQVVPLHPFHHRGLLLAQATGAGWRSRRWAASGRPIGGAPTDFEVFVPANERLVVIVGFVFSILSGPRRCIPD